MIGLTTDQLMMQSVAGLSVATPLETAAALGIGDTTPMLMLVFLLSFLVSLAVGWWVGQRLWGASKDLAEVLHHDVTHTRDCNKCPNVYIAMSTGYCCDGGKRNYSTAVPTQEQSTMSLEQALEKNTAAVNALNETIGKAKLMAHTEQPGMVLGAAAGAQAASKAAKVPTPEALAANAAAEAAKAVAAAAAPDYEKVVNPLILKCAQVTTRATAGSILATFTSVDGKPCTNGKHVKPEDYASLVQKLNAAIAAVNSGDSLV